MSEYAVTFTQQAEVTIWIDAATEEEAEEKAGQLVDQLHLEADISAIKDEANAVEVNTAGCWDQQDLEEV